MTRLTDDQRRLAGDHYRLALFLATPFAARDPGRADDYFSDALLALVSAASRFDPARGVKFATFAARRV